MTNFDGALGTQYTLRLAVTLTLPQNIAANQSTLPWACHAIKNLGTGFSNGDSTDGVVNIGGAIYPFTIPSYSFVGVGSILLAAGSTVLTHNADGTLTPNVSAYWDPEQAPDTRLAAGSAGGTFPLPNIPRGPFYGTGGAYQRTLAYYGTGGAWQQCLVYYGSGGTWNLVGG